MSTFDGYIEEFPDIRIDYFRHLSGKPAPLACFLSHVHSDHLTGLESLKAPFVYCSSATRELLLRLELYPHRVNYEKGLLERRKQTYKHLSKIIKPLPLDTPITLELCPSRKVQVTLLDANHCLGAVMFLIEGESKVVLYTGDVRCEMWWLNSLTRNPVLLPYATGVRQLDKIYLDTTFAVKAEPYSDFPSKAEGVRELLTKLSAYPEGTLFYLRSWTYGYEDVWMAVAHFLKSQIHLDEYRYRVYTSIAYSQDSAFAPCETPHLVGFKCGNDQRKGILTRNDNVRVHSCEARSRCATIKDNPNVVEITPVVSRHRGVEIRELGAGGGKSDLDQNLELQLRDYNVLNYLQNLYNPLPEHREAVTNAINTISSLMPLKDTSSEFLDTVIADDSIMLKDLPTRLSNLAEKINHRNFHPPYHDNKKTFVIDNENNDNDSDSNDDPDAFMQAPEHQLPTEITFPYSRHSSYTELRALVAAFKPTDVHPCTVPSAEHWTEDLSMQSLFGDLCNNATLTFAFDEVMRLEHAKATALARLKRKRNEDTQLESDESDIEFQDSAPRLVTSESKGLLSSKECADGASREKRSLIIIDSESDSDSGAPVEGVGPLHDLHANAVPLATEDDLESKLHARRDAFVAAKNGDWASVGLISLHADESDDEL